MKKKKKNKNTENSKVIDLAVTMNSAAETDVQSDVLGSYTGVAEDTGAPVQDADDL